MVYIYDTETFRYDRFAVFKSYETNDYEVFHNDDESMKEFMTFHEDDVFIGFNTKAYDQFMVRAMVCKADDAALKELNDFLIGGGNGWEYPEMDNWRFRFNNVDITDDMQLGQSLKSIEGHLGMNIQETEVDFNLDRPLTEEEVESTIFYCKHDVDATEALVKLRTEYLGTKLHVGRMAGLPGQKSLSLTNAKLTAALLKAVKTNHDDERKYVYPDNLLREYVPQEVFDYFNRQYDESLSDDEVFQKKLNITIGETPVVIGYGGIHAALKHYQFTGRGTRILRNWDVASYYPSLMIQNHYISRNIPDPAVFEDVYHKRIEAKRAGDKNTANALKLVLNTTYGATLNQYNDLYDPLMARSVCISGQLYLLELAEHLTQDIAGLTIIQLNTDGIMVEFEESDYNAVCTIVNEWQERTHFALEEDKIAKYFAKDVNNYIEVADDGGVKIKGGYLTRGISKAGAFKVNNTACIVPKAIIEYFVNDTEPAKTILECDDISQFQMIAKAGSKYREAYHMVNGEKQPVQKVNRVYASADERYGKLFKIKAETDGEAKIDSLPEHCVIDNDNHLTISDIDKSYYVDIAWNRIRDFMGIREQTRRAKSMAAKQQEPQELNIYKRLGLVRQAFLEHGISKNGKNVQLKAMYFQLEDIVPVATVLFNQYDLFPKVTFTDTSYEMHIIDCNHPETEILFSTPAKEWNGNAAVTPVQALGATITYMRRYLYMMALDIVECDELESNLYPQQVEEKKPVVNVPVAHNNAPAEQPAVKAETPKQEAPKQEAAENYEPPKAEPMKPAEKPKVPVNVPVANKAAVPDTASREEVKAELTKPDGQASELQIKQLKAGLKKVLELKPELRENVNDIAVKTEGFTNITKESCESLIQQVSKLIAEAENA